MVEVFQKLLEKRGEGVFHVTNPGTIRHKEILELYKKYVDHDLPEKEWISEDELVWEGLAVKKRSTNKLQSSNLAKIGIEMRPVLEAAEEVIKKYAEHKKGLR
jgi:dTDP-4-dehydrorhamnose reductase